MKGEMIRASGRRLADRLGCVCHVSPLDFKIRRLREKYPNPNGSESEDWLLDLANYRGARVVFRPDHPGGQIDFPAPRLEEFSNEELVAGILLLSRADEPQLLRIAAQLISRGELNLDQLLFLAKKERFERGLKMLSAEALKVDVDDSSWKFLASELASVIVFDQPLIHWTRLAEPQMRKFRAGAESWELVR